ncbi:MAG: hypothetical protein IJX46_03985 [Clostridia bacterium]|nr:hypothetical protein [Clostridia bacterium]
MKTIMPGLLGNRRLARKLGDEILAGSLSHAYIISGPRGSGKHTLALNIAAALACENKSKDSLPLPCGRCLNCEKILGGISPDISVIGLEDKASIGVDVIRQIRLDTLKAPNDTETKVYIIEDADKMTVQAQNAFLLTLEEPPSYVLFLLLCERPEELLETVRSRAPVLRTEPLSAEQIADRLAQEPQMAQLKKNSPDEFYETVMAADGKLGTALRLANAERRQDVLDARRHAEEFVVAMSRRSAGSDTFDVLSAFPKSRAEISDRLTLIITALRDLCLLKRSEDAPLCFYYSREDALELSDRFTVSALISLTEACESARLAILRSANTKLTLLNLVSRGNYGK